MEAANQTVVSEDILEIDGLEYDVASAGSTEQWPLEFKFRFRLPEDNA
jgi:hypothetical protein